MFKRSLLLLIVLSPVRSWAGESRVYPTSALATVRQNTHGAIYSDLYNDPYTLQFDTWSVLCASSTWIPSGQMVFLWFADVIPGTTKYTITGASITLEDYTQRLIDDAKNRSINNIVTNEGEQYMIYYATGPCRSDWHGWSSKIVNGHLIADTLCP